MSLVSTVFHTVETGIGYLFLDEINYTESTTLFTPHKRRTLAFLTRAPF